MVPSGPPPVHGAPPGYPNYPHPTRLVPSMVTATAVLMLVLTFLHFCGIGSGIMNLVATYGGPDFLPGGQVRAHGGSERLGQLFAYVATLAWSVVGLVWAPFNAYGLFKRKAWARTSAMIYGAVSLATCCCLPFGAFVLWAMLRSDVKTYFQGER